LANTRLFRAPGRVNLIGEHTDYNDGFVLPVAISFYTSVQASLIDTHRLELYSENFNEQISIDLADTSILATGHWSDYPIGVAVMLGRAGFNLQGAHLSLRGDVPIGSGLSSSAAIEVATAHALTAISDIKMNRAELALLCQKAENEFVGAQVGIMDQFISLHGKAGHALLLDCRSLDYKLVPLSGSVSVVVCNTSVKHELAGSAYNERRAQCEAGVKHLSAKLPNVKALRDVTIEKLQEYGGDLSDVIYRRCRHVITENARTLDAAQSLERGDLVHFGNLMNASHWSLRDDYEVSCKELDLMVELAHQVEGVYGARMTGGGFGGCTVNLVMPYAVPAFETRVLPAYEKATGLKPEMYVVEAADGASEVEADPREP
jgi:galactokinase